MGGFEDRKQWKGKKQRKKRNRQRDVAEVTSADFAHEQEQRCAPNRQECDQRQYGVGQASNSRDIFTNGVPMVWQRIEWYLRESHVGNNGHSAKQDPGTIGPRIA